LITLQSVTHQNWRKTLTLAVDPDQQSFVADYAPIALVALAKAYVRPMGWMWLPYAICADEAMVGFLELAFDPNNPEQCWLFHFFIDRQHQNKGYGKQAVRALIVFVRAQFPNCRTLLLTVHPDNQRAKDLYVAAGFADTGKLAFDEPLYQCTLGENP
jgi:diamine N-acetyltransferase